MNSVTHFRKSTLHCAVVCALTLGTGIAHAASEICATANLAGNTLAASTDRANFTMLSGKGFIVGGTNDVAMTWDGTAYNSSTDYIGPGSAANVTAVSTTGFFSYTWTAHDIQLFLPGNYSFDTALGGGNPESGTLNATVPAGMLGMHMLFDWNGNLNIDVFVVVAPSSVFGSGVGIKNVGSPCTATTKNCLWTGKGWVANNSANAPSGSQKWMLGSVDGDGGGIMGIPMAVGGPFAGFNANFSLPGTFSNLNLQNTCAAFVDTVPNAFSFTPVTGATQGLTYPSNAITVSGLGVSPAAPDPSVIETDISITNGQYSIDGGTTWSNLANTPRKVKNNDTVMVRGVAPGTDGQTTSVVLTIGGVVGTFSISTPAIATAQGSNFTMLDGSGGITGGTNDVVATWDGSFNTNENDLVTNATAHMTISSVTPFFSQPWTAHHIRVFGPGSYQIDTTCTIPQLEAGTSNCNNPLQGTPGGPTGPLQTQQYYNFTVDAGQVAAHMLFDWNNSTNIDVVIVWNQDQAFGSSQMYTGAASCNSTATLWDLMSTDWDGDGQNGVAMVDGPFQGFKANFNIRLPGSPVLTCSEYEPSVNVGEPTGTAGGGCSISARSVNPAERGDWWLVAGFLMWLGALRMRFKRQAQS